MGVNAMIIIISVIAVILSISWFLYWLYKQMIRRTSRLKAARAKKDYPIVYDDCSPGLERYSYLITLTLGPANYQFDASSSLVVEFLTSNNIWLTRFVMQPNKRQVVLLRKWQQTKPSDWTIEMFSNRIVEMKTVLSRFSSLDHDIGLVRLSHDCHRSQALIFVHKITLESLHPAPEMKWSFRIASFIGFLPPTASSDRQTYRRTSIGMSRLENEDQPENRQALQKELQYLNGKVVAYQQTETKLTHGKSVGSITSSNS